jgi:hypothetical protein
MSDRFEKGAERGTPGYSSRPMVWLLGNMFLIPVRAFIHGMELLVKTMQGMQNATDRTLGVIAGEGPTNSGSTATTGDVEPAGSTQAAVIGERASETDRAETCSVENDETTDKERVKMPDTNLNDDMLKLVRYKILFIRRDYEYAFPEKEELVYDNMTDSAFTAWKVAEFIQSLDRTEVPTKWREKIPSYPPKQEVRRVDGREMLVIHSLPETDKKFLRVYFEVLQRYAREKLKYEEDQLDALRGIREAIEHHGVHAGPPGGGETEKKPK